MKPKLDFRYDPYTRLYLPLWQLDGASFMSKDAYGWLFTTNGTSPIWTPLGRIFDGVDDYLLSSSCNLGLNGTIEVTVMGFAYLRQGVTGRIINKQIADAINTVLVMWGTLTANCLTFNVSNQAGDKAPSWTTPVLATGWHSFSFALKASAFNTTDCIGVIDGVVVSLTYSAAGYAAGWTMYEASNNLYLGVRPVTLADPFDDTIGELLVSGRALTPLEMQDYHLENKWRWQ